MIAVITDELCAWESTNNNKCTREQKRKSSLPYIPVHFRETNRRSSMLDSRWTNEISEHESPSLLRVWYDLRTLRKSEDWAYVSAHAHAWHHPYPRLRTSRSMIIHVWERSILFVTPVLRTSITRTSITTGSMIAVRRRKTGRKKIRIVSSGSLSQR